jgi:hypothetical protein
MIQREGNYIEQEQKEKLRMTIIQVHISHIMFYGNRGWTKKNQRSIEPNLLNLSEIALNNTITTDKRRQNIMDY